MKYLKDADNAVQEKCKVEQGSSECKTDRGVLQGVEHAGNDERHDKVTEKLCERQAWISFESLKPTPQAKSDLLNIIQSIRGLGTPISVS